jgi:hypothetical protein
MCLQVSYKKKLRKNIIFLRQKKMKEVGSGSISQRCGSVNPHQNVTDPQHWVLEQTTN